MPCPEWKGIDQPVEDIEEDGTLPQDRDDR